MENVFSNGALPIKLGGRMDTSDAPEVEKEIFALLDEYKPEKVILSAEKLEYIFSTGLRNPISNHAVPASLQSKQSAIPVIERPDLAVGFYIQENLLQRRFQGRAVFRQAVFN